MHGASFEKRVPRRRPLLPSVGDIRRTLQLTDATAPREPA